jgi:hypothetical protein
MIRSMQSRMTALSKMTRFGSLANLVSFALLFITENGLVMFDGLNQEGKLEPLLQRRDLTLPMVYIVYK